MTQGKEKQMDTGSNNSQKKLQVSSPETSASSQDSVLANQQNFQPDHHERFDAELVISKFEAKFGPTGSRWLSVIGALLGVSCSKIKNVLVLCDGKELDGFYSIDHLMATGHLANRGLKSNHSNRNLFYISHIAAALPHSPFLFLEVLDEDDVTVSHMFDYDIRTSLPMSLRYFHAANLPLGPKTRKAHVLWSINFAKMIKSPFDGNIYQRRARNAVKYHDMDLLMALLDGVESDIVLTDKEMKVSYPLTRNR